MDVKPDNFLIGLGREQHTIYAIDYGKEREPALFCVYVAIARFSHMCKKTFRIFKPIIGNQFIGQNNPNPILHITDGDTRQVVNS